MFFNASARTGANGWSAEAAVTVGAADVTGVTLSLAPSPEVSGQAIIEDEKTVAHGNS
jgi:hypothetical protein